MKTEAVKASELKVGDVVWDLKPPSMSGIEDCLTVEKVNDDRVYMRPVSDSCWYVIHADGLAPFDKDNSLWWREV